MLCSQFEFRTFAVVFVRLNLIPSPEVHSNKISGFDIKKSINVKIDIPVYVTVKYLSNKAKFFVESKD